MRILLVSQFWPGPADPDLGVFVVQVVRELEARGHEVDRAVVDRRGGSPARHPRLVAEAVRLALRRRPDVIFAHFLVPAGAAAALASLASRTPLVVMAHGQDVRNAQARPAVRAATRAVLRRASAVIANSAFLRDRLPPTATPVEVVDCGVDLERFAAADAAAARDALGLGDVPEPVFLFAGSLVERKNVVRLADAFARLGEGTLTYVGDGPLRGRLDGRPGVRLAGRVPHAEIPGLLAESHVLCQPSLIEPLGQALLEAMACGRSVVATRVGGPPEFVPPAAGVLVDPLDLDALAAALRSAAALPRPNEAARVAAAAHDVRLQAEKIETILSRAAARQAAAARRSARGRRRWRRPPSCRAPRATSSRARGAGSRTRRRRSPRAGRRASSPPRRRGPRPRSARRARAR